MYKVLYKKFLSIVIEWMDFNEEVYINFLFLLTCKFYYFLECISILMIFCLFVVYIILNLDRFVCLYFLMGKNWGGRV